MTRTNVLPKNTAEWDRSIRFAIAAALFFGLPTWVHRPYLLLAGGIVAGFQLVAAFSGF
jgi:hypothetical protein